MMSRNSSNVTRPIGSLVVALNMASMSSGLVCVCQLNSQKIYHIIHLKIEQKQQYCSHILGNDKPHIVHCQLFHLHTTVKTAIEEPSNTEKASCSSSSEISWP